MQILPIIERELRVVARQPRTWWRRVYFLLAGLAVFAFIWLERSSWGSASTLGRQLFDVLGGLALICALLGGPLLTVDCLAKERRGGTLGLLFLTDLHSFDVVLGKMFAAVFDMLLGVLVVLPLIAIPMLLGGVGFADFGYLVLAIFNLLFFSVALGGLASACFTGVRASLGFTLVMLFLVVFGQPLLFETILGLHVNRARFDYLYMFCPLFTFYQCFAGVVSGRPTGYWLNIGGVHALAWCCLVLACWKTSRAWRELPGASLGERWQRLLARFSARYWSKRRIRRERLLSRNPVLWLENRDPLQSKVLWAVFLATTAFWLYKHLRAPRSWPDEETVIFWALLAHWIFCAWLAIQAPRRMADDKQSGALELLLCTAVSPREIVRGAMRAMALRFGTILAAMVALNVYGVYLYVVRQLHGFRSLAPLLSNDVFELACCGAVVIPVQAYAFARVGLYQGLARGSSLRATWHLILKLGVLPWIFFLVCLFALEVYRRYTRAMWPGGERYIFALWVICHLGICGFFLLIATVQLRRNFRHLAAQSSPLSVWSRLKRLVTK